MFNLRSELFEKQKEIRKRHSQNDTLKPTAVKGKCMNLVYWCSWVGRTFDTVNIVLNITNTSIQDEGSLSLHAW